MSEILTYMERAGSSMSFVKAIGSKPNKTLPHNMKFGGYWGYWKKETKVYRADSNTIRDEIIDTLAVMDSAISSKPLTIAAGNLLMIATDSLDLKVYSEEIGKALPIKVDEISVKKLAELRNEKKADFLWKRRDCNPSKKDDSKQLAKFAVKDAISKGKVTESYTPDKSGEDYENILSFDFDLFGDFDTVKNLGKEICMGVEKRNYVQV